MSSAIVSIYNLLWWWIGLIVILPPTLVVMRAIWPSADEDSREQALLAALVTSPFIFGGLLWALTWYQVMPLSTQWVRFSAFLLFIASLPWIRAAAPSLRRCVRVGSWFLIVFSAWAVFRAYNPEIFWGEKPMDFSFLNYLVRAENLPPDDPWAAGHPLNYYYFGQFSWAIIHKLTGVDSSYGYNLALSSVGSGLFFAVWLLLKTARVSERAAILGAILIALGSNFEWIRLLFTGQHWSGFAEWLSGNSTGPGFDFFWATSRLLTSPAITEYHSWSVMFGDLHAHTIALPLSTACYAVMLKIIIKNGSELRQPVLAWGLLGYLEALLYATNSWEAIPHGGFFALCLFAKYFAATRERFLPTSLEILFIIASTASGAAIFLMPWLASLGEPVTIQYGWVVQDFATAAQLGRHFGQFLIPLAFACCTGFFSWPGKHWWVWIGAVSAALALPILAVYVAQISLATPPFGLILGCAVLVFLGTVKLLLGIQSAEGVLLVGSGMLVGLCELIYVMDHTNTLFKLYLSIWTWLGAIAVIAISHLKNRIQLVERKSKFGYSFALLAAFISCAGTIINARGLVLFHRVEGPRPTLNGMVYLPSISANEAKLIYWMRRNIKGVPVLVEAFGESYREFGRIVMNTGLPSVLGWDYHISQRGVEHAERRSRLEAVNTIYQSENINEVLEQIRRFKVKYIVVGSVERKLVKEGQGSESALEKFSRHPELFEKVFKSEDVELYSVRGT